MGGYLEDEENQHESAENSASSISSSPVPTAPVFGLGIMLVAEIIPLDLLAFERRAIFRQVSEHSESAAPAVARANTLQAWQHRWDEDTDCRWTSLLIRDLGTLVRRAEAPYVLLLCWLVWHGKTDLPVPVSDRSRLLLKEPSPNREGQVNLVCLLLRG